MLLSQIPSGYLLKFATKGLVPFFIFTLFSIMMLFKLDINPAFVNSLPLDDEMIIKTAQINKSFTTSDFIIISVEDEGDLHEKTVGTIKSISRELNEISDLASVVSLTTIKDIEISGDVLSFISIFDGKINKDSINRTRQKLQENLLFKKILLSKDESAHSIYAFPQKTADYDTMIPEILEAISDTHYPGKIFIFGEMILKYYTKKNNIKDFLFLGFLTLIIIYFLEILISGSLITGSALLLCSILPTVWILGLFSLFGIQFQAVTILVPVIVLALSTSYGIHLFRYCVMDSFKNIYNAVDNASPIILNASLTTIIGFSTLLVSRIKEMRIMGALLITGIAFSALASLFVLPVLLCKRKSRPYSISFAELNIFHDSRAKLPAIFLILLTIFLFGGIFLVGFDYRVGYHFKKNNPISSSINHFYDKYNGIDQLEVIINTEKEYGLIDRDLFHRIKNFSKEIENDIRIGQIISFIDFVEWANGRMSGNYGPLTPKTNEEIGETLEILSSGDSGFGIDSFVDASYSKAKIIIRFGNRNVTTRESGKMLLAIERKINEGFYRYMPNTHYDILGTPLQNKKSLYYIIRAQLFGILLFFSLLFIFLIFLFKSFKWAFITIVPTCLGVVYYFGLMGWLGIPLTHPTSFSIGAVMGVSVDDSIYFILFFRNQLKTNSYKDAIIKTKKEAGVAIIQTTFIISAGLSVLLFSTYSTISHSGLLTALSLIICTMVTLIIIPHIILWFFHKNQKVAAEYSS